MCVHKQVNVSIRLRVYVAHCTERAEPETVISRASVQSPDPAEEIVSGLLTRML